MNKPLHQLPSLKALRVFEVVARCLNFRLAADELDVTQGAVAQLVRGLEAELRIKLFERHSRGLALTEAGAAYAGRVRRALEEIAEATRLLRPGERHVTISVAPTIAAKWLLPRLPRFTARHPDIDLRVLATERVSTFHTDGIDLSIRHGRPPFGPGLETRLLFENTLIAVGSPSWLAGAATMAPERLAGCPLIHDAHDAWPAFLAQLGLGGQAPSPSRGIRFNQTALAIDAAIAGQGLALASAFFVAPDLAAGRLVQVVQQALRTGFNYYVVSPRRSRGDAPLAEVDAWLTEEAMGQAHSVEQDTQPVVPTTP
ncbi:LysR substrate-binding domain-containing protein [Rhodoferax sp.]|uniref:LysR substrate-binding domain-containing protein n=1 Tax=Rhodoferax sp. TaxID=50421 RepID=UPI00374D812F